MAAVVAEQFVAEQFAAEQFAAQHDAAALMELSALGAALAGSLRASTAQCHHRSYVGGGAPWCAALEDPAAEAIAPRPAFCDTRRPAELCEPPPGLELAAAPQGLAAHRAERRLPWTHGASYGRATCGSLQPGEPAFVHLDMDQALWPSYRLASRDAAYTSEASSGPTTDSALVESHADSPTTCGASSVGSRRQQPGRVQAASSDTSPRSSGTETMVQTPPPKRSTAGRLLARFVFCIPAAQIANFQLVPRIIGRGGSNVKAVAKACGGKVRVRGRGSGYREGPSEREADLPLQAVLSCSSAEGLEIGVRLLTQLLSQTSEHFMQYCKKMQLKAPARFYVLKLQDQ